MAREWDLDLQRSTGAQEQLARRMWHQAFEARVLEMGRRKAAEELKHRIDAQICT